VRSKHSCRGAKVLSAKVTAQPDTRRSASLPNPSQTLNPPMTSVVVERHQPVNKVRLRFSIYALHAWVSEVLNAIKNGSALINNVHSS